MRSSTVVMSCALCAALLFAVRADGNPPRFVVQFIDGLPGTNTQARSLNEAALVTGKSGPPGAGQAFVWYPDGTLLNINSLGFEQSRGVKINEWGQVAGVGQVSTYPSHISTVFRYSPATGMIDIGTLGGTYGDVYDMNAAGTIIGYWMNPSGRYRPYVYADTGGLQDLGTLPGDDEGLAWDINDAGAIVGYSQNGSGRAAVLWDPGASTSGSNVTPIGTLGGASSEAYYINEDGSIVGRAQDGNGTHRAFRWTPAGGMEDLQTLPGATQSVATWITNGDHVFGNWTDQAGMQRVFYAAPNGGEMVSLDLLVASTWGGASNANSAGQTVGSMVSYPSYQPRAFYFGPDAGAFDLNELLAEDPGFVLEEAPDINEAGQIVAFGPAFINGAWRTRSVLLTPAATGDVNCDGAVNASDIDPFVLALTDPDGYAATHPRCAAYLADIDGDGSVTASDIDGFVQTLVGR